MAVTQTPATTLTDLLFEKVGAGLCLVAPDSTIVRVNAEWLRSTGFTEEQVVGENVVDLFPDTRDMALAMHARARAGLRVDVPRHAQVVNGRETWWEGSIEPVPMAGGTGLLITAREVSARAGEASAEDAGRIAAERDRALDVLEHEDSLYVLDSEFRYVLVNEAQEKSSGKKRDQTLGRRLWDVWPEAADPKLKFWDVYHRVMRDRVPEMFEEYFAPLDLWAEIRVFPTAEGGIAALFRRVNDRKRAEAALRGAVERHEQQVRLFDGVTSTTPDFVYVFDLQGRFLYANRRLLEVWGIPLQDAIGKTCRELGYEQWHHDMHMREIAQVIETKAPIKGEVPFKAPLTGIYGVYEYIFTPVVGPDGKVEIIAGTSRDVTERKQAEEALRASEAKLRSVLENMSEGLMLFDSGVNLIYQNPASLRIHGFEPDRDGRIEHEALPTTWEAWDDSGRPITFEEWPVSRVFRGERFQDQVLHVRRVETGQEFHGSYNGSPILDAQGRIVLGFITIREITEEIRARDEQARAEAALREANAKLVEADRRKDEFLGMLSHELRNPLAPIRNSTYVLQHAAPGSEQARRAQAVIQRQTEHLTRLVDDLLDVTRIARGKIELRRSRVDLRDLVWRAADDFRLVMHDRGVRYDVQIPDREVWADGDATRITQIVGNLLHNAAKFTRQGDVVTLGIDSDATAATIRVRDTGAGIDPDLLPRIFDAFVQGERTLARTEGGLGLGLALVKGIAELHGGTVHAESAGQGKGAEFTVRLPLLAALALDAPPALESRPANAGHRVLVVDDNADAAESLADIVRLLGHSVDVVYDGATAIERARATRPDVVLCDLGLPDVDGYAVAKALRAGSIDAQLVAVSGYAQPEDVRRAIEAGFDEHVAKPPDPARLERILRR